MAKKAEMMATRREVAKKNTFITGTVKDLIEVARIGDGEAEKVFRGKLTTRDIGGREDKTRTQFSTEISSQIPKEGKKIVLEKFVGERENTRRDVFEIFNLELHKKGLSPKKRMEQIRNLPHFEETRKLVLKGIGSVEWDLIGIENKLSGARSLSDQVEVGTSRTDC